VRARSLLLLILALLACALPIQAAAPRCTITAATLAVAPDTAEAGAIVLATARVTVASPCVFKPILRVGAGLTVYQYADASSLGEALVEWPITAAAPGVSRLDLLIDGAVWDTAALTVAGGTPSPVQVRAWLPLVARGAEAETHAVWLPLIRT
jgi:hypothetical protein